MKRNNRKIIEQKLNEMNFEIGCYDATIDKISKVELQKIIDSLHHEWTDVDIKIRGREYVIEICTVDNEKDLNVITKEEYILRYGDERYNEE